MNSATRRDTGTTHSVRRFINDLDPLTLCTDPSTEMAIPLAILPGAGSETVDVPQEVSWRGLVETALAPLVSSSHLRGTDRDTSSVTASRPRLIVALQGGRPVAIAGRPTCNEGYTTRVRNHYACPVTWSVGNPIGLTPGRGHKPKKSTLVPETIPLANHGARIHRRRGIMTVSTWKESSIDLYHELIVTDH